jgi:type IX secretion system PorP/SprF family membrane protein
MKTRMMMLFLSCHFLKGQDIHFSQFTSNPHLLNPALCGSEGKYRVSATFKDQWNSVTVPYRTYGVSYDTRFNSGNWKQIDNTRSSTFRQSTTGRLAAGISVYNDESGDGKMGHTQANLSLASFLPIGREHFLSLGLQGSFVQKRLNSTALRFPDQFENTGFQQGSNSGENLSAYNFSYPDLAAGLLWYYGEKRHVVQVEQMLSAKVGLSVFHLLKPDQRFLINSADMLRSRLAFHGDFVFGVRNTSSALCPSFLYQMQGSSKEFIVGAMLKTYTSDNSKYTGLVNRSSFGYGLYYRSGDAIVVSASLDLRQRHCIVFSYDVNVSRLRTASNYRGGFELSLKLTPGPAFLYEEKDKVPDTKSQH